MSLYWKPSNSKILQKDLNHRLHFQLMVSMNVFPVMTLNLCIVLKLSFHVNIFLGKRCTTFACNLAHTSWNDSRSRVEHNEGSLTVKKSSKQHTQWFRKAFSALIQRTEAFNFRKYKIGLDFFFSPQIVIFPFPMKCCCSLLFKQLELKYIPSLTLDLKDDLHIYLFFSFWLRIRPFLKWHFSFVLFWFKCP